MSASSATSSSATPCTQLSKAMVDASAAKPSPPILTHLYTNESYTYNVYQPSDDSWTMCDALSLDREWLLHRLFRRGRQGTAMQSHTAAWCVEIGSGSGVCITHLATAVLPPSDVLSTYSLAIDKNPIAAQCTRETFVANHVVGDVINGSLLTALRPHTIDVLVFNPPYVHTEEDELLTGDGIDISYAGGKHGRVVIDQLLPTVSTYLSARGVFYLLLLPYNQPGEICQILATYGLQSKLVLERRARNELIQIYKFYQADSEES